MLSSIFDNREITSFGVSVGTGLALESVFTPTTPRYDEKREIPVTIQPNDYKVHAYNVYTIIRNIVAATREKDKLAIIGRKDLKDVVIEEIETIKQLYSDYNDIELIFYTDDYKKQYKRYNHGKDVKTTKTFEELLAMSSVITTLDKLPVTKEKTLVMTSYLVDLVECKDNYYLLESNTGKLKNRSELSNKYYPVGKNKTLSVFPVNKYLLFLLGDKTVVRPVNMKLRKDIYQMAINRRWTVRTSDAKIRTDLRSDPRLKELLDSFR